MMSGGRQHAPVGDLCREWFLLGPGKGVEFGGFLRAHPWASLVSLTQDNAAHQVVQAVFMSFKIARQPIQELGVAGWMLRIHLIHRVHQPSPH